MKLRQGSLFPALIPTTTACPRPPRLPLIARLLVLSGVSQVRIEYEGHWDIAQIDLIRYLNAAHAEQTPALPRKRIEQIEDCFRKLADERHPKWEKDEGAFGEFIWDVQADTLEHEHNRRYIALETTHVAGW